MNTSVYREKRARSAFNSPAMAYRANVSPLRPIVWLGHLDARVEDELIQGGWACVPVPLDDDAEAGVSCAAARVGVVDFGAGDAGQLVRIAALLARHHELQWIAVGGGAALTKPRVCDLIDERCVDFLAFPLRAENLSAVLRHAWARVSSAARHSGSRANANANANGSAQPPDADLELVGASETMDAVRQYLRKYANFDMSVLLTGETGTGKDVAARVTHACSARHDGPMVAINCGALPEHLVQSELFGHERGAFTGASARKIGRIEAADGGVVFLDEIGDLPLDAQSNLLRFLEDHRLERVGGTESIRVDVRVIAATHVDLPQAVRDGRFREDLYYRLNVLHVHLPPLRDRGDDAQVLAQHFLDAFRQIHHTRARRFSGHAVKAIADYSWPGNVRELLNRVQRAAVTTDKPVLEATDLELGPAQPAPQNLKNVRSHAERELIAENLRASNFNMSECARRLNISRATLYRLCHKHQL